MERDKLIENLKHVKELLGDNPDDEISMYVTGHELDLILQSLTAPVDGKECFTQAEISEMKEERYNTGYNVGYSEGKLNGYHPF